MKNKTSIHQGKHYHEDGIETITIILSIATVVIIFTSIFIA